MADMVRENEQRIATYREQLKEKDERIKALEQELRSLKNSSEASSANHEAAAKVDRNDLAEIHRRYAAVLSTLNAKKCSLNNAYRLAGTARSTIRDSRAENCDLSRENVQQRFSVLLALYDAV